MYVRVYACLCVCCNNKKAKCEHTKNTHPIGGGNLIIKGSLQVILYISALYYIFFNFIDLYVKEGHQNFRVAYVGHGPPKKGLQGSN